MYRSLQLMLASVLNLVGHEPKEAHRYSKELVLAITQATLTYAIMKQPVEQREALLEQFKTIKEPNELETFLGEHFEPETIKEALGEAITDVMNDYFSEVAPELNEKQAEIIGQLLEVSSKIPLPETSENNT